jgi:glucose/arabinose dehydrogenase
MPLRARSILLVLALAGVALAGCTKKTDEPPTTTPTPTATTGATPTTPTTNTTPAPKPTVAPVTASGAIQGPFEGTWKIALPAVAPKSLAVSFNLTGAQPGAPPTAVVSLVLTGPDAKAIKTATIGLGQSANAVAWTLGPADATTVGDYTLKATSQAPPAPVPTNVPSGGVANYALRMAAEY